MWSNDRFGLKVVAIICVFFIEVSLGSISSVLRLCGYKVLRGVVKADCNYRITVQSYKKVLAKTVNNTNPQQVFVCPVGGSGGKRSGMSEDNAAVFLLVDGKVNAFVV